MTVAVDGMLGSTTDIQTAAVRIYKTTRCSLTEARQLYREVSALL